MIKRIFRIVAKIVGYIAVAYFILMVLAFSAGFLLAPEDAGAENGQIETTQQGQTQKQVDPQNPYDKKNLTVAVEADRDYERYRNITREALDYWEQNSSRYAGYPINYDIVDNQSNHDIVVNWTEEVDICDLTYSNKTIGCADLVVDDAPSTVTVDVERGYLRSQSVELVKHELGHTLGLDHDDEPEKVMSENQTTTLRLQDIDIAVHYESRDHDEDDIRRQLSEATGYMEQWMATNVEQNATYEIYETPDRNEPTADVLLVVDDNPDVCDGNATCSELRNTGVVESQLLITTANVREDAHAWVVAYYLTGYHAIPEDQTPEPLQDEDSITTDWWEN